MLTYECCIENYFDDGSALIGNHAAENPSKARYAFWKQKSECLNSYSECFRYIKVRSLGRIKPEHFYNDNYDFERMSAHRGIEFAHRGMRIDVDGKKGYITGGNSSMNLDVLFDAHACPQNCHPNYETTYYDNSGNVIKCFKKPTPNKA
jgi:hypothetical protein